MHSHPHPSHGAHGHGSHGHSHLPGPGDDGPGHELSHQPRYLEGRKKERGRLITSFGIALLVSLMEAVGGWLNNSVAQQTDAGHMFADASSVGLSLLAIYFGARPADQRKTFGYYRLEILAALANGLLLFAIAAGLLAEAWSRIRSPEPVNALPMMGFAVLSMIGNGLSVVLLSGSKNMNVRGVFLHVLGDLVASGGVFVAALVMWRTHWWRADSIISLVVVAVIVASAYRLVLEAVDVLLEAAPSHLDSRAIVEALHGVGQVVAVHDLHVWTIASGMYALSAHIVVAPQACAGSDEILLRAKQLLAEQFHIDHTTLQIESEKYEHLGEQDAHA